MQENTNTGEALDNYVRSRRTHTTKEETMKLTTPIKPGFRRPFTVTTDENVENPVFTTILGDATGKLDPANTLPGKTISGWINGDGALDVDQSVRLTVDAHVGEGAVDLALDFDYQIKNADATAFGTPTFGPDEPIPAP